MAGTLYLIPVPLGPSAPQDSLHPDVLTTVRPLRHFVVEQAKSARAFLKAAGTDLPLQELQLEELNEHSRPDAIEHLLAPLRAGHDVGLLSEAGCPAVADPGADLVALAQRENIRVVPLIGPSSLLLALMASGLNGQRFAFQGYLPAKDADRNKTLRELEAESRKRRQTQLFIETPYRNRAMFDAILQACQGTTRLCVATDLTLPGEFIRTLTVAQWKKQTPPEIERRPTVFLLLA
ncbi:SAM-dependent methyltransferase [uncultured Azonexus sp.]|uniref:SAM-dependent methyltransferase n=1 Tax=uncultured Azonexus sp. TaxID=520307 RepID=UPI00263268EF|nr:SAM-dependent methyltransferase [uncultured Azonexus sp.]